MIATQTEQDAQASQMSRVATPTRSALTTANALPHPFLHAMTYDVLLGKTDAVYLVRPLFWTHEVVIADTREAALEKARHVIRKHLFQSEIVSLSVESEPQPIAPQVSEPAKHPLAKFSGMFAEEDPYWDIVQEEIERYRDELDRALGAGKYMADIEQKEVVLWTN